MQNDCIFGPKKLMKLSKMITDIGTENKDPLETSSKSNIS